MGWSEKKSELKQRRHRRAKIKKFREQAAKASASEKAVIAGKLRLITPGAQAIINELKLEER